MSTPSIPFIDLQKQREVLGAPLEDAILAAVRAGKYILGPEVKELEAQLAKRSGVKHAITCANGTESLALVLMAKGVKPGDAVFVPSFTFIATAEVVAWLGATPVFVDVTEEDFNIDPNSLKVALSFAKSEGLKPVGIVAVDLFGRPAKYDQINAFAAENDLWVMADAAQSYGGSNKDGSVGSLAETTATSFFPAKPLGCYGDGGAVFTDSDELAQKFQSLRVHGKGTDKYDNVLIGMNSRLDTVQAAVLLQKLSIFDEEIRKRQTAAEYYNAQLSDVVKTPDINPDIQSAWAQYTLCLESKEQREQVMAFCKDKGVPTMIYYPTPLSSQTAYKHYPCAPGGVPVSDRLSDTVMSLPMHPYLETDVQDYIVETLRDALAESASSTSLKAAATAS